MKKNICLSYTVVMAVLMFGIFTTSCTNYKNLAYFDDLADTAKPTITNTVAFKNPTILPDDILTVTISTLDKDLTAFLNGNNTASPSVGANSSTPGQQQNISGYMVDKNGMIELPFTGPIKVSGLTTAEAKELIETKMSKFVNTPLVNVRFANFKITVLGEVTRPATYVVPNEKINLFDALGLAGDLTVYGKRENVLLIRDTGSAQKNLIRMNLNSKDIVSAPYFYLKPNDIIYVEPNKYKLETIDAQRNRNLALIVVSGISLITILISRDIIFK